MSIRQANLSFTARVDLCSFLVPGAVPGDSVPQELSLSVLSHWSPTWPIGPPVVLSFSQSEEETQDEKRSLEIQNIIQESLSGNVDVMRGCKLPEYRTGLCLSGVGSEADKVLEILKYFLLKPTSTRNILLDCEPEQD